MATIKGITVQIGAETTGLKAALKDVENESSKLRSELKEIERQLKFDPHNVELWAQKQKVLNDQVEATREKLNRLKDVQAQVNQQFQEGKISEEQYRAFQREIAKTESQLKDYEKQLRAVNLQNHEFNQKMQEAGKKLQDVGKKLTDVGKTLSTRLTAPLAALGGLAAKTAIDFESAFASVRKTVDATEEEFAALERGIRDMAKEIPAAATEIAGVAEAAGQLGIQNEHILSFTRTMIDLGESTNMSAEQAATALARLANITQMPQSEFDRLGSTIVALGNNLATTEAEIVEMSLRLAGAGKQVGMTEAEILSFAGALSSVGIAAEAGGSAFSKVMIQMQLAAETGGAALDNFARVAGMSAEQFARQFRENAAEALIAFINGLQRAQEQGTSAIKVLDDIGITEVRMRDALLRAAGAGDLFAESIRLGTQAWEENTALTNEAAQRYETTASKLEIMRNRLQDVAITFGEILLPPLVAVAEKVGEFADWLNSLDPILQKIIVTLGLLAAAAGPIILIAGQLVAAVGALLPVLGTLSAFINTTLIPAIKAINWPAIATVGAIAALAAVAYEVYRAWDEVKAALAATWEYLKASAERLALNMSLSFEQMKHAVINAVGEILERLSVLENLPFGLGDKFAGLKDKIGEGVDGSKQKIAELEAALETNATRMAEAAEGMKVALGDVGAKVAEDVQAVIRAITGQTEAYAEELGEQTDIIIEETEAQTAQVRRTQQAQTAIVAEQAEERTEIISKEAEKQEEERAKFEEQWNQKLFNLQATRREKLQAEYDAAIELAEKLGADTTAIHEYYRILLDQMDEEEQKVKEERLKAWRERLKEATASELDLLVLQRDRQLALIEDQMQEELELAGDNEEAKTLIMQFWALKRQQVLGEYADAVKAIQEQEVEWLQSLEDRLTEATATEEELLAYRRDKRLSEIRAQMEEELKMAEGNEEAIANITKYWLAEILKAHEEYNDALRALQEQRVEQLQTWTDMLFELTASEEDLLRRSGERQIAEVEARAAQALEVFKDNAEAVEVIIRARDAKIEQITKDTNDKLYALEQEKLRKKETLYSEWYDKLAELTLSEEELLTKSANERIAAIEKAAEEAIKAAEGDAELIAIIEQSKAAQILAINEQLNEDIVALERTRLQQQESILKSWQNTLFDFQATEEDRLRKQAEDKIAALEKQAEADKKRLQEIGAEAEAIQQIEDNLAEARRLINQQLNQDLEALANQRVQREEDILRSWEDILFDFHASEEDRLRKQATDRIEQLRKRAEAEIELVKDNAEAVEYIENALAEAIKQINEQLANDLKVLEDRKLQEHEDRLKRWQDRLFEATASEEELLRKRAEDRIAELERIAAKEIELAQGNQELILAIEQATALEIKRINEELQEALDAPRKAEERDREAFEEEWRRQYLRLIDDREALLQMDYEKAIERAKELGADLADVEAVFSIRMAQLAEEIADEQKSAWEKALDAVQSPMDRLVSAITSAADSIMDVGKAIRSGNWGDVFLSLLMETEAFAKAMELIGAVLHPVVTLFDAVLKPIINGILGMWNGIIDALASISIFGWKPFAGLKDKRIPLVGEDSGAGGGGDKGSSGGRQVSEITGPTRDLLVDLLSPLAHLAQIVAPIQDIRQILYERLPNFNTLDFAGAGVGVGAMGPTVIIENLNVTAPTTGVDDISRATIDKIEKALAGRIAIGQRGRGGR